MSDRALTHVLDTRNGVPVLTWPGLEPLGVDAVVTTRGGGVSTGTYTSLNLAFHVGDDTGAVLENRRRAANALGAALDDLVVGSQVHGAVATIVTASDRGHGARSSDNEVAGTDALVTTDVGPVLVILVADCVPILLIEPQAGVLACAHAGWRGTTAGVVDATLRAMTRLGARRRRVIAALGPAVAPDAYEVGAEVAAATEACLGEAGDEVLSHNAGCWHLDLWAANRLLLVKAGVPADQVHLAAVPTGARGPFYSHRAEQPCGRFGLLARLRS